MSAAAAGGIGATTASGAAAGSVAGPYGTVIGAVVGAGIGVFSAISGANAQAEQDNEKAAIAFQQANELALREQENDANRQITSSMAQGEYAAQYAGSGRAGKGISGQLEIQRQTDVQTMLNDQDAAFQEQMYMEGGQMQSQAAQNVSQAGTVNAVSTVLGAAVKIGAGLSSGWGSPSTQPLPGLGPTTG